MNQIARGFRRGDIARNNLCFGKSFFYFCHAVDDALRMSVRRIQYEKICACVQQRARAVQYICGYADGRSAQQSTAAVLCGIWIFFRFKDILDGDQSAELAIFIDQRKFFNFVMTKYVLRLFQCGTFRRNDQIVFRHYLADRHVEIIQKTHVSIGNYTNQVSFRITDRYAGNAEFVHKFVGFIDKIIRRKRKRIGNNAVLVSLNLVYFFRLPFDRHILVDRACTTFARNGDGEISFGHGIHRRAHQRNIQFDFVCKTCF